MGMSLPIMPTTAPASFRTPTFLEIPRVDAFPDKSAASASAMTTELACRQCIAGQALRPAGLMRHPPSIPAIAAKPAFQPRWPPTAPLWMGRLPNRAIIAGLIACCVRNIPSAPRSSRAPARRLKKIGRAWRGVKSWGSPPTIEAKPIPICGARMNVFTRRRALAGRIVAEFGGGVLCPPLAAPAPSLAATAWIVAAAMCASPSTQPPNARGSSRFPRLREEPATCPGDSRGQPNPPG